MHYQPFFDIMDHSLHNPKRKYLQFILCRNVNQDGIATASHNSLAKISKLDLSTVIRNIEELELSGELVRVVRGISEDKSSIYLLTTGMSPAKVCYILQRYFDLSFEQAASRTRQIFALQQLYAKAMGISLSFDCDDYSLKNLDSKERAAIDERKNRLYENNLLFRQLDPKDKTRYKTLAIHKPATARSPSATTKAKAGKLSSVTTEATTRSSRSRSRSQIDDLICDLDLRSTDQRSQIKDQAVTIDPLSVNYRHLFNELWAFYHRTIGILYKSMPVEMLATISKQMPYENGTQFAFKSLKEDLKDFKNTHVQQREKTELGVAQVDCVCDPPTIVKEKKQEEPSPLQAFTQQLLAHSIDLTGPMKLRAKQEAEESIQWLYEKGYTAQECKGFFNEVVKQSIAGNAGKGWRKGSATWNAVTKVVLTLTEAKGSRVAIPSTTAFTTADTTQPNPTPQSSINPETLAEMKRETERAQAFEQLSEREYQRLSAEKRGELVFKKAEEMLTTYRDKFKGWSVEEVQERAIYEVKKGLAKAAQARQANAALA